MPTLEEIREEALALAKIRQVTHDEATLVLIHHYGHQNVDFSGGARAEPQKPAVPRESP